MDTRVATRTAPSPAVDGPRPRSGALDGLRAVAVLAVLGYHLWPATFPGGFLGVDLFMVLSGYLITGILLDERARSGTIRLRNFWGRRFRRIVPPLLATVTVVAIWVDRAGPATLRPTVRAQGLFSLAWATNWKLVYDGTSYATLTKPLSPLLHLWSLAVEEQFYVVWPLLVLGALALWRGRHGALVGLATTGVVLSAAWMALLYDPGADPLRLYYGSDTRAQTFLVGGLTAVAVRRWEHLPGVAPGRRWLTAAGPVALFLVVVALVRLDDPDLLYRGGFLVFALVAAVAVAATSTPAVRRVLDHRPLRAIGRVSYGIYLWHWPAIALLTPESTDLDGWQLLAARLTLVAFATTVSWVLIERPFARAPHRRTVVLGMAGAAVAVIAVALLPGRQVVPYAGVDVDHIPPPQVVEPSTSSAPAPTASTTSPSSGTTPSTLVPAVPGTLLIVGDSGMYDEEPALAAAFGSAGWRVVSNAFPGVGLTHPSSVAEQWSSAVAQYDPDLVIVMLGSWDIDYIDSQGASAYTRVVDDSVARLTAGGARVLWLSMLPGGATPDRAPDSFYEVLPRRYPGTVDYLDIGRALAAADGTWPRVVDGRLLRKEDEWHLCPDGAAAVASAVVHRLALAPAAWLDGTWRSDPRYDDPPGACTR